MYTLIQSGYPYDGPNEWDGDEPYDFLHLLDECSSDHFVMQGNFFLYTPNAMSTDATHTFLLTKADLGQFIEKLQKHYEQMKDDVKPWEDETLLDYLDLDEEDLPE